MARDMRTLYEGLTSGRPFEMTVKRYRQSRQDTDFGGINGGVPWVVLFRVIPCPEADRLVLNLRVLLSALVLCRSPPCTYKAHKPNPPAGRSF